MQIIILGVILIILPMAAGLLFTEKEQGRERWIFAWISGQMLLWAGFHFISIPMILKEKEFSLVVTVFGIYAVLTAIAGMAMTVGRVIKSNKKNTKWQNKENEGSTAQQFSQTDSGKNLWEKYLPASLWILFGILLLLQLVLTGVMAYEEGDDAFYVAISTVTESSDTMYRVLPYLGIATGLDARHGLAPFPIWVAWLSRVSGIHAATVAHIGLPLVLILMAYGIYYLMARRLFQEKPGYIPFFMVLLELLVFFGGYSVYSAENFLLVRASQGKAVIGNIIIPFIFLLFMMILEKLQKMQKTDGKTWCLLALTMTAGCLCSTQGTILTCTLLGVVGICTVIGYRRWKLLLPMICCGIVPVGMALLYFMLR